MTGYPSVETVGKILEDACYVGLKKPFQISKISFDVPAAYIGSQPSPDLILIVDTEQEHEARICRKVEGVARALDVVGSRRPITTIITGPKPSSDTIDALTKVCRVLPVGSRSVGDQESALRGWLSILLPLELPEPGQDIADPINEISKNLEGLDSSIAQLVQLAPDGADAVQSGLNDLLNESLRNCGDTDGTA